MDEAQGMKRVARVALALGALLVPRAATADDADEVAASAGPPPANLILADLGLHVIGLGYQRTVTSSVALQADVDWYVPWTQTDEALDTMGAVLRLRPVFFVTDDAPKGLWISPFVQGGFVRADRGTETKVGPAGALGASVGYALLIADHLHLSAGAGVQVHGARVPGGPNREPTDPSFYGPYPHLDGTVGYAF